MKIGVVGATGYTGAELLRLLTNHPEVEITYLTSEKSAGENIADVYPHMQGAVDLTLEAFNPDRAAKAVELLFCALPHGHSHRVVPELVGRGCRVIDLSADFRLKDANVYQQWYKQEHSAPSLLPQAVYGLPEFGKEKIKGAMLVANPGCYPTASLLALAPLAKYGLVCWPDVIIDAKTGISGAGKTPKQLFHYPERTENFEAYKVGAHQHTPEIEQQLSSLAGEQVEVTFTPHLVPMSRGILVTVYLRLKKKIDREEVVDIYRRFYQNEPFVRLLPHPVLPATARVRGSNFCDLAVSEDRHTSRLIILAAIDNLVKGAAGQAVQNLNIMAGFEETTGLQQMPLYP